MIIYETVEDDNETLISSFKTMDRDLHQVTAPGWDVHNQFKS